MKSENVSTVLEATPLLTLAIVKYCILSVIAIAGKIAWHFNYQSPNFNNHAMLFSIQMEQDEKSSSSLLEMGGGGG